MFRRALPFDLFSIRTALIVLAGVVVMLLTVAGADAAEPAPSTPTAWEYTHETTPATARQPVASTAADLRLATGLSIAAVIVIATVLVGERQPVVAVAERDLVPERIVPRQPASIRTLAPAEALPEAA